MQRSNWLTIKRLLEKHSFLLEADCMKRKPIKKSQDRDKLDFLMEVIFIYLPPVCSVFLLLPYCWNYAKPFLHISTFFTLLVIPVAAFHGICSCHLIICDFIKYLTNSHRFLQVQSNKTSKQNQEVPS